MCKHPFVHYLDGARRFLASLRRNDRAFTATYILARSRSSRKDSVHDALFFFFSQELASSSSTFLLHSAVIWQPLLNSPTMAVTRAFVIVILYRGCAFITTPSQNYLLLLGMGEFAISAVAL